VIGAEHILLLGAGLFGGIISALVGGASLVTIPALLAAGLSPVAAVTTNLAALTPGGLLAVLTDRGRLPRLDKSFMLLIAWSGLGTVAGSMLLLLTPERLFEKLVPVLLAVATLMFAFAGRVSTWIRSRASARNGSVRKHDLPNLPLLISASIYNGYFGAGTGIMLLALFAVWRGGDYRTANVTKNLVAGLNSLGASIVFAAGGAIDWKAAGVLGAGALVGSLIGGHTARHAPYRAMQAAVDAIGTVLTISYAWRYWL
jgi:uncharacterized membrane protein YfcA